MNEIIFTISHIVTKKGMDVNMLVIVKDSPPLYSNFAFPKLPHLTS